MQITEAITRARAQTGVTDVTIADEQLVQWLSELDGQLAIVCFHAETWQPYDATDSEELESDLFVSYPWDGEIYTHYLESKIYFATGEYERYEDAKKVYEDALARFRAFVARVSRPAKIGGTISQIADVTVINGVERSVLWTFLSAYGVAVKHGYVGTEEQWLDEITHYNRDAAGDAAESAASAASSASNAAAAAETAAEAAESANEDRIAADNAATSAAGAANAASQSAGAASTSASDASASASQANRDKGIAAQHRNAAANSAQEAQQAKEAAQSAAENAASTVTSARKSATSAEGSATAAESSATTAEASAQAASEDATAAEAAKIAALAAQSAAQTASSAAAATAQAAANSATAAQNAASAAAQSAEDSEAWAVGQRGGADVPSTDETYHNNAKYWAEQAEYAAGGGVTSVNGLSGAVTLTQDNVPAGSTYARVTPAQVQQIADNATAIGQHATAIGANQTAISGIKNGASINSFAGVETALAGKQNTLTFDQTPTAGSSNPVTSDGIATALAGKQNTLTFDQTPTAGSGNPVTSGGIATALAGKAATASVPASMAISAAGVMTFSNASGAALFTGQLPIYDGTAVTA